MLSFKKQRVMRSARQKLQIIEAAKLIGNRKAAKEYKVNKSTIRGWLSMETILKSMHKSKRTLRKRNEYWPALEQAVYDWVIERREQKMAVSTVQIRLKAKEEAQKLGINDFKSSCCWCDNFMKRNSFSVRKPTSVGQTLPSDWQLQLALFQQRVALKKVDIDYANIGNLDEVSCSFDLPATRTVELKGSGDVRIATTGHEKTCFTIILAVTADGGKLPPMVIFKHNSKIESSNQLFVTQQKNAWVDSTVMKLWLNSVWKKPKKSLLILDTAPAHRTLEVKNLISEKSNYEFIPPRMTSKCQPLDLTVNRSFKSKLRAEWEEWMLNGVKTFTTSGRMRRPSYSDVCGWITSAWNDITIDCVKNGFAKAGIVNYEESIENSEQESVVLDLPSVSVDEIPDEIWTAIESFKIEDDLD